MTVKSVRGRRRYTSFRVPAGTGRNAVSDAVSDVKSAKVVTCERGYAVIRSLPEERGAVEKAMVCLNPGIRSEDCSGTLRALRERNPVLKTERRRGGKTAPSKPSGKRGRGLFPKPFILRPLSRRVEYRSKVFYATRTNGL